MALSVRAGRQERHDALVEIIGPQGSDQLSVTIESPVRDLFGPQQDRVVEAVLAELGVHSGDVHVHDQHALDFVLRARVRAAVERFRGKGGRI